MGGRWLFVWFLCGFDVDFDVGCSFGCFLWVELCVVVWMIA